MKTMIQKVTSQEQFGMVMNSQPPDIWWHCTFRTVLPASRGYTLSLGFVLYPGYDRGSMFDQSCARMADP